MTTALLLLEIQNDYFPNGRIPLEKSLEATTRTQAILQAFRDKKLPVIHVQHISTLPDASYLLPCTRGAEFYSSVQPAKGEAVVKKHYANSFKDTTLLAQLNKHKVKHLVICGMMTQQAVDATVRAASDLGFTCSIIHDACAAKQLEFNQTAIPALNVHHAFLAALQAGYATLFSTDEFLQVTGARIAQVA